MLVAAAEEYVPVTLNIPISDPPARIVSSATTTPTGPGSMLLLTFPPANVASRSPRPVSRTRLRTESLADTAATILPSGWRGQPAHRVDSRPQRYPCHAAGAEGGIEVALGCEGHARRRHRNDERKGRAHGERVPPPSHAAMPRFAWCAVVPRWPQPRERTHLPPDTRKRLGPTTSKRDILTVSRDARLAVEGIEGVLDALVVGVAQREDLVAVDRATPSRTTGRGAPCPW